MGPDACRIFLTSWQQCWRRFSRELQLLLTWPPLPQISGLCKGGANYSRSVQAPSHTRAVSQSTSAAVSWVGITCHLCPSPHSSSLTIPLPLFLPAERKCDRRQRRPRQPIFPFRVQPQGGNPPSLRPPTRQSPPCPIHHLRRINHQSSQVQVRRKVGDYRCFRRRGPMCRRTRASRSCSPST